MYSYTDYMHTYSYTFKEAVVREAALLLIQTTLQGYADMIRIDVESQVRG